MARTSRSNLVPRQPHRHPHQESLRQFDALAVNVQQVAVVQRLHAEIVPQAITIRTNGICQTLQIEPARHVIGKQFSIHPFFDTASERLSVRIGELIEGHGLAEHVVSELKRQDKPGSRLGVSRLQLDLRTRCKDQRVLDLLFLRIVVEVSNSFIEQICR